jgi:Ulp1 family protease
MESVIFFNFIEKSNFIKSLFVDKKNFPKELIQSIIQDSGYPLPQLNNKKPIFNDNNKCTIDGKLSEFEEIKFKFFENTTVDNKECDKIEEIIDEDDFFVNDKNQNQNKKLIVNYDGIEIFEEDYFRLNERQWINDKLLTFATE